MEYSNYPPLPDEYQWMVSADENGEPDFATESWVTSDGRVGVTAPGCDPAYLTTDEDGSVAINGVIYDVGDDLPVFLGYLDSAAENARPV